MRITAVVMLLAGVGGCSRPPADNLLLICFDTTRADHLSAYGYGHPTSPSVDALANQGTLFEFAFTHVPSTLPAHSSMFTGLLPPTHGVRANGKFRLADANTTLAERLRDAGFDTAAILGAFPLAARFGLDQGFEAYDDDFSASAVTARRQEGRLNQPGFWIGHDYVDFERGADEVTDLGIRWLEGRRSRWFLFVHYFDPHWPYEPPDEWAGRFDSPYDAEIAFADHHLGRLLDAVAKMPGRTLTVFTADHGEGLGEHNEMQHNRGIYNSTLHVPLIVTLEGIVEPARRIASNAGHVDLLPTVLELLGEEVPEGLPGTSLAGPLQGGPDAERGPLYAETLVWNLERPAGLEVRGVVDGGHKLIDWTWDRKEGRLAGVELYDFHVDPGELQNLATTEVDRAARLAGDLATWVEALEDGAPQPETFEMDEGTRERLKSLGYLADPDGQ